MNSNDPRSEHAKSDETHMEQVVWWDGKIRLLRGINKDE